MTVLRFKRSLQEIIQMNQEEQSKLLNDLKELIILSVGRYNAVVIGFYNLHSNIQKCNIKELKNSIIFGIEYNGTETHIYFNNFSSLREQVRQIVILEGSTYEEKKGVIDFIISRFNVLINTLKGDVILKKEANLKIIKKMFAMNK